MQLLVPCKWETPTINSSRPVGQGKKKSANVSQYITTTMGKPVKSTDTNLGDNFASYTRYSKWFIYTVTLFSSHSKKWRGVPKNIILVGSCARHRTEHLHFRPTRYTSRRYRSGSPWHMYLIGAETASGNGHNFRNETQKCDDVGHHPPHIHPHLMFECVDTTHSVLLSYTWSGTNFAIQGSDSSLVFVEIFFFSSLFEICCIDWLIDWFVFFYGPSSICQQL